MGNLDLIVATSIAVVLFAVFIVATLIEFNKMGQGGYTAEKKNSGRTTGV